MILRGLAVWCLQLLGAWDPKGVCRRVYFEKALRRKQCYM